MLFHPFLLPVGSVLIPSATGVSGWLFAPARANTVEIKGNEKTELLCFKTGSMASGRSNIQEKTLELG